MWVCCILWLPGSSVDVVLGYWLYLLYWRTHLLVLFIAVLWQQGSDANFVFLRGRLWPVLDATWTLSARTQVLKIYNLNLGRIFAHFISRQASDIACCDKSCNCHLIYFVASILVWKFFLQLTITWPFKCRLGTPRIPGQAFVHMLEPKRWLFTLVSLH